ncbi:MAG TPA: PD-(D/E)XK nuclease family protein, partial [Thermoanaerobaculia bacterium]|nr:PD-(D/E)XK nuclease family protein [Thermoanaerobaculia bacterium]
ARLFVVGLDDARHPGSTLQDPIILDSERQSIDIPIIGDRPQRNTEEFKRLLARAGGREITLSWPLVSVKDRRERFPSPVLLDMLPNEIAIEKFVDPQPLSQSEWWLLRRFAHGATNLRDEILSTYENLRTGAEAEEARNSDAITAWDGLIAESADVLDPRTNEKIYSASQLERMAGCPYRHFLERILRIRPIEDIEFDPDIWLQAMDAGSLLHEVLETAMGEICKRGEKPSLAFLPRMKAIADVALQEWRDEIPPPSESAFARRRDELFESCAIFLRVEEDACRHVTPTHFELEFGPYRLPLGHGKGVMLRGRVDRVDKVDRHNEWHVWDYKSGSTYQFDQGGILQCGTKIQHAIYARAVEDKLGGRVTKSGYYFPTSRGAGARLQRECTDKELKDALNLLFDTIRTGWFPHGGEDACTFCDFAEICGGAKRAAERTERKATDTWRKLQEIE